MSYEIDFIKLFTINQYLLCLLIGVGFIRLIATPKQENLEELPKGKKAFLKTYFGVHLFGSVINLSSFIIIADKLSTKKKLSEIQLITLSRAFSSDAFWSPFFVAFAAALTYAPNLDFPLLLINGLLLAFVSFLLTYFEIKYSKNFSFNTFYGYPISFSSIYIPILLAVTILFTHYYYEDIKIIVLISLYSILLTFIILPFKKNIKNAKSSIINHIFEELPNMKTEISLFLIAGFFGMSVSFLLLGMGITLPFDKFDWKIASILLLLFLALGFIGIHPIITLAVLGDILSSANHTLLASSFLIAWALNVSTSAFSGLNLMVSSRYKIEAKRIFKLNIGYTIKIYLLSCFFLYILSYYLGI